MDADKKQKIVSDEKSKKNENQNNASEKNEVSPTLKSRAIIDGNDNDLCPEGYEKDDDGKCVPIV